MRFEPLGELLALSFGEFAGPPWGSFVHQTRHAFAEILLAVIAPGLLTKRQHLSHFADTLPLSQGKEGMEAFDQFQRAAGVGLLKTAIELLAGERAELEGKGHERYLLRRETSGENVR
jgi:hypothetical protein